MIHVTARRDDFIQEICELVRAFYPHERVEAACTPATAGTSLEYGWTREDAEFIRLYVRCTTDGAVQKEIEDRKPLLEGGCALLTRRRLKNHIKLAVYELVSGLLGRELPWGALTGIRPTKLLHQMLEEGALEGEALLRLQREYRMHPDKAALLLEIARNQRPYLSDPTGRKACVYVHIPFCTTRCLYCSFPSGLLHKCAHQVDAYLRCLDLELSTFMKVLRKRGALIDAVYVGGGTPTALTLPHLNLLLESIKTHCTAGLQVEEWTVEAGRPDSLDMEKLTLLKASGVDRISINPQTINQQTLDAIGRSHTAEDIARVYEQACSVGFDCINMDMILGLPGEDAKAVSRTLEAIGGMDPENLTIHTLALKRASDLKASLNQHPLAAEGAAEEMAELCRTFARDHGYRPYYLYRQKYMLDNLENVGYAKAGKECRYNIHIMEERRSVWAFGAGAISKAYLPEMDRVERAANVKNVQEYIARIEEMIEKKMNLLGTC